MLPLLFLAYFLQCPLLLKYIGPGFNKAIPISFQNHDSKPHRKQKNLECVTYKVPKHAISRILTQNLRKSGSRFQNNRNILEFQSMFPDSKIIQINSTWDIFHSKYIHSICSCEIIAIDNIAYSIIYDLSLSLIQLILPLTVW